MTLPESLAVSKPVKEHPATSSPRTQRKRAADFTGLQGERLAAEKATEQEESAARLSMITAQETSDRNAVVDFETGEPITELDVREVMVDSPKRTIRVNTDIDQMTWGREVYDEGDPETGRPARMGPLRMFTFKEGQAYRNVQVDLADHLHELGYLSYYGA
jgi:hypothetical protein